MGKLYVGTADDADVFHDLICLLLQFFLKFFGNGQHGGGTERVTGVDTHRIHVFDKAYGDHVVVLIPDHFQFQFFPAQNGLFHQHLADEGSLQTSCTDGL